MSLSGELAFAKKQDSFGDGNPETDLVVQLAQTPDEGDGFRYVKVYHKYLYS